MATYSNNVAASSDDARNVNGNGAYNGTVVTQHIGILSSVDYWAGFRWLNVTIPQGSTINSATVDIYYALKSGTTVESIWYGVDEDDATTFANTTANKPEGKTRTTASVTDSTDLSLFTTVGFGNYLFDVAALVQEIINRPGWSSGNALAVVAHDNGSSGTNSYFGFSTYDFTGNARGAILTIDYTAGGGTTGQIKAFTGGSFVAKPVKVWNGSSWETKPVKYWNGSTWVTTTY